MPRTLDELLEPIRARRAARLEDLSPPPTRGLLAGLGRVLDYPGRKVREFVTGRPEATGRDVLQQIGLAGPNQQGFDVEDVLGFGAEVALDPLTYLGGIGTLTKGGKAAKALGQVDDALGAASDAVRLATNANEATRATALVNQLTSRRAVLAADAAAQGVPSALAKGLRGQAELGQRSLLKLGIPFTGVEANVVRGAPVLGALGKAGGALRASSPVRGLEKLFNPRYGRLPETEAIYEQFFGPGLRSAVADQYDTAVGMYGDEAAKVAQSGLPEGQVYEGLVRNIEDLGVLPAPGSYEARFGQEVGELGRREIQAGAKGAESQLGAQTKAYYPRVRTPASKKEAAMLGLPDMGGRKITTRAGFQKAREESLLEQFTPDANKILAASGSPNQFQTRPSLAFAERATKGETTIAAAKLVTSLADNFSKVGSAVDDVPLSEFFAAAPLRRYAGLELPEDVGGIQKILDAAGLGDRAIPKPVFDEFVQVYQKISSPPEVANLMRIFDKATAGYRAALTVPFPAFHVRNLFSDTVMSWLNGGANPAKIPEALQKAVDPAWIREAEIKGLLSGSSARWIEQQANRFRAGGPMDLMQQVGRTGKLVPGKATERANRFYAQFAENFSRTWHYLSMKAKGLSDVEAVASVKKALFDFSELTQAEKIIAKRLVLFYNWPRKVVPAILGQYIENPAKMAALTRGATNPSAERPPALPEFVNRGAAIPLGPTQGGGYSVLSGLGLPLEELSKLDPTSPEGGVLGALKQYLKRGGELANPLLSAPAEIALGRDFRTGRDILSQDRADPLLGRIPGLREAIGYREETLPSGELRPRADPLALWALRRAPVSRGVSTAGQIADLVGGREDASLLRLLTGAQRFDLDRGDMLRATEDALEGRAKGLQRTGELRTKELLFAPGAEGEKSPEAVALVKKLREIEKLRKAENKTAAAPR